VTPEFAKVLDDFLDKLNQTTYATEQSVEASSRFFEACIWSILLPKMTTQTRLPAITRGLYDPPFVTSLLISTDLFEYLLRRIPHPEDDRGILTFAEFPYVSAKGSGEIPLRNEAGRKLEVSLLSGIPPAAWTALLDFFKELTATRLQIETKLHKSVPKVYGRPTLGPPPPEPKSP
jgi:hypothetical protein